MKELYSIGETAKIMGISVQTLRNYSNMDLLQPQYTDDSSGYRYYSFNQFHLIDRIKYLRNMGLSLAEISDVIKEEKVEKLSDALIHQQEKIQAEIQELKNKLDDIEWYNRYFNYFNNTKEIDNVPYIKEFQERYIIYVDWIKEGGTVESVETRLAKLRNCPQMEHVQFYRQFGYIADFEALMENRFQEQKYFIYLKEKPEVFKHYHMCIPAGKYLCFRAKIRTQEWDTALIRKCLKNSNVLPYIVADEYEDNLQEYHECPYEVQIGLI